jgi:hypothetical protein
VGEFHPRYGFTFSQNLNGTFICKSEGAPSSYQHTLIVNAVQNPKLTSTETTEFVSSYVTVECESKRAVKVSKCKKPNKEVTFAKITTIETKTHDGELVVVSSNELTSKISGCFHLTCMDNDNKQIWKKVVYFLRKSYLVHVAVLLRDSSCTFSKLKLV